MSEREGDNKCVQIKAITRHGKSVMETTEDIYNTFDDLIMFFMDRHSYETFDDLIGEDIEQFENVSAIVDYRDNDITYVYSLVNQFPTQHELKQEAMFADFIATR